MKIVNFNDDDLQFKTIDAGGGSIYFYQWQPLTGIIKEYYDNGNLAGEMEYKDGYCNGIVRLYYDNGQIKQEYSLKFNSMYGAYKYWDENGILIRHILHDNDGNELQRIIG